MPRRRRSGIGGCLRLGGAAVPVGRARGAGAGMIAGRLIIIKYSSNKSNKSNQIINQIIT